MYQYPQEAPDLSETFCQGTRELIYRLWQARGPHLGFCLFKMFGCFQSMQAPSCTSATVLLQLRVGCALWVPADFHQPRCGFLFCRGKHFFRLAERVRSGDGARDRQLHLRRRESAMGSLQFAGSRGGCLCLALNVRFFDALQPSWLWAERIDLLMGPA